MLFVIAAIAGSPDDEDETVATERLTTTEEPTTTERSTTTERETTTTDEPTTTEAPTTTTTEEPTTTEPPTTATTEPARETIAQAVDDALGGSNRDVDRLAPVTLVDGHVAIKWAINDNLTEGLVKDGARIDGVDILRALSETGVPYNTVSLEGTFPLVDQLGNSAEERVVLAT